MTNNSEKNSQVGKKMDNIELLEVLNDKINTLRIDLKDDIVDLKNTINSHLENCEKEMKCHQSKIESLEETKNKSVGIIIGISSVAGTVSAFLIWLATQLFH